MNSCTVKLWHNKSRVQKNGNAALYLMVYINGQDRPVPLELVWPAHLVDNKAGSLSGKGKDDTELSDINMMINTAIGKANEIFKRFRLNDRVLTMDLFLKDYKSADNRQDFLFYMATEIANRYHTKDIEEQTFKNHNSTLKKLKEFKSPVLYYEMTSEFLMKFSRHLKTKKKNNDNTVWSNIRDIKTYMARAQASKLHTETEYLNFPTGTTTSRIIYLEDEELKLFYDLYQENELGPVEQQSLRCFLFQCFTSLRISDTAMANWGWVNKNNDLHFLPQKSKRFKRFVTVPLSQTATELIESKRGLFFNLPQEPTINEKLKLIAARLGINKNISTHVGRHTFGTLFYRHTKDLITLSKIMGHTKIQQTMVYAHINDQDKRDGVNKYESAFLKLVHVKPAPVNFPVQE